LLVVAKLVGFVTREPGRERLARTTGGVQQWFGQFVRVSSGPDPGDSPAMPGIVAALRSLGVQAPDIRREVMPEVGTGRRRGERWQVPLPLRVSLVAVNVTVTRAARDLGLEVIDAWEEGAETGSDGVGPEEGKAGGVAEGRRPQRDPGPPALTMSLGRGRTERYRLEFVRYQTTGGSIAVVIDDFGLDWDETAEAFLRFPAPLTLGVLPGYRSSRRIADAARARGFEVLLHLPMEPEGYPQVKPGPEAILVDQHPAEVRARIRSALRSVGKVEGISSHMGSRATTDADLMRAVLDETGQQGLFFVDTWTTARSVVSEVARKVGTPFLVNRLFLDQKREKRAIAARLAEAAEIAEKTGEIVVVAHGYPETLAALTEALPKLKARGLVLVPASALVKVEAPI
jgi:polysaccharide deacetylase 2 family uncharacterized protein YibQ